MCDDTLLQRMKHLQVNAPQLKCTQNTNCWCNDLSFRFPMEQIQDVCMSPSELLTFYESQMTHRDISYLKSLSHHEFIVD